MVYVNVRDAKTHLFKYLEMIEKQGETVVLCRHNRPIVEMRQVKRSAAPPPRKFGLWVGHVKIKPEFYDPLPDDLLAAFNGDS